MIEFHTEYAVCWYNAATNGYIDGGVYRDAEEALREAREFAAELIDEANGDPGALSDLHAGHICVTRYVLDEDDREVEVDEEVYRLSELITVYAKVLEGQA